MIRSPRGSRPCSTGPPSPPSVTFPWTSWLLLDEHQGVALGVVDGRQGGAVRSVEGFGHESAAEFLGADERRAQVAHLNVEDHGRAVATADAPARTGFRAAEPGRDLHHRTAPGVPVY